MVEEPARARGGDEQVAASRPVAGPGAVAAWRTQAAGIRKRILGDPAMKRSTLLVLGLALVLPSAAQAAPSKEHLQMLAEIRMLQEQQQQLQAVLGTLQDTLKAVTTKLDDQAAATRKAMADQTLAVNNIGDNVRMLREKTDETNVRISSVSQEIEAMRQTIASQPAPQAVAPAGGGVPNPDTAGAPPPQPSASATVPPGTSPQRMFDSSYDDYMAGRYELAITGFENFIQAFPRLAQAAEAQYNIGMSYYNQGNKWAEARDAFQKVITDHPQQTDTVSQAYYKLGQTYEQLKQLDNAKKAYETAVQKYPGSAGATLANQALQRLNRR
jgi:TolA-binding protein